MLGLSFCARAFSNCGEQGPLSIAVRGPLTVAASLVAEHRLQTRRLSSCGSRAQLLRGMWDLPRPGLEPASPASADRLSTTVPPGKPQECYLLRGCIVDGRRMLLFMVEQVCLTVGEVWSRHKADTRCTLGRERKPKGRENFLFKFFLSCIKYEFYFTA